MALSCHYVLLLRRNLQNLTMFLKRTLGFLERRPATLPFSWDMIQSSDIFFLFLLNLIFNYKLFFSFNPQNNCIPGNGVDIDGCQRRTNCSQSAFSFFSCSSTFFPSSKSFALRWFNLFAFLSFFSFLMASASSSSSRLLRGKAELSSNRDSLVSATTVKLHVVQAAFDYQRLIQM